MTFQTIYAADGETHLIDGYQVPQAVYDTLRPSRLFPGDTPLTPAQAAAILDRIKAEGGVAATPPGVYIQTGITLTRPLKSDALAVHTSQIPAVVARNKKHGLSIRYDRAGRPVFTDAAQRKKLMKIESEVTGTRIVDRKSYY